MSLYSGIKLSVAVQPDSNEAASSSTGGSKRIEQESPAIAINESEILTPIESAIASKPKTAGEWSAALKFAPRIPKPKTTTVRPPPPGATTTSQGSSTPPINPPAPPTGSKTSTYQPDIVRSAEPQVYIAKDEVLLGADGKPLAKAPAMTLTAGKKGKRKLKRGQIGQEAEGKKKRKKKKRKVQAPVMPTFDPDEQYDPYKPNDLGEYQYYRKKVREERRAQLLEDKRRKAAGESSEGSSYYTDSSEDEAPRRDAPKMFAPPKQYSPPPSARPPSPPPAHAAPPPPMVSGDDAYARRVAMASTSTGDDAYARRAEMSQASTGDDAYARRAAMSQAGTGDDVYARRAAMAAVPAPSAPPPPMPAPSTPFIPPPAHLTAGAPMFRPPPTSDIPGFGSFTQAPPPPTTSATQPPLHSVAAAGGPGGDFAAMLEERKKAAQAIAAKLSAMGMPAPAPTPPTARPPPPQDTDNSGTFAEKMFRKWGHVEGSGLGARGEGIKHALAAEHVEAPPKGTDPSQPQSKRQIAKQKAAAANAKNKNRKWVQHGTTRGKIVNSNEDERAREEQSRLGEASRIICLVGLVNGVDEVDEELSEEIGEEASKHGIVERVVLHMVEPPPEDPRECLRVFIVFSGMAGAWRATKELDGRFFGGKKIRVTYFDEAKFDAGDRDGPILHG